MEKYKDEKTEISAQEKKVIEDYNLTNTEWLRYRLTGELPGREMHSDIPGDFVEGEEEEPLHEKANEFADRFLKITNFFDNPLVKIESAVGGNKDEFIRDHMARFMDMKLFTESPEDISHFLDKVEKSPAFIAELNANPKIIFELWDIYRHQKILEDPYVLSNFSSNINSYYQERNDIDHRVLERIKTNPVATDEELDAGVYKEYIESQVVDAVFALRKKGYNSFESGFDDRVKGEQILGFDKAGKSKPEIPDTLIEKLNSEHVQIKIEESNDRYQIVLTPVKDMLSIEQWKDIWSIVANEMPPFDEKPAPRNISTKIARDFVSDQQRIQRGAEVFLGYGLKYKDGKVIPSKKS